MEVDHKCNHIYYVEHFLYMRFEVFTLVLLKIQVFWDVTQCHQTSSYSY